MGRNSTTISRRKLYEQVWTELPCPIRAIAALRRGVTKRELVGEIAEKGRKVKPLDSCLMHPPNYVEVQISPVIKNNDMTKEVVWTYLVDRKYEDDHKRLCRLLCGQDEEMPHNSKIWLEAYLHPTRLRREEVQCWRSRADLSMGHLEGVEDRQLQIRSKGDWVCICEAKWSDDIHQNSAFPNVFQFSQLIEHAILLHDRSNNFPERVYITLITPRYYQEQRSVLSKRNYWRKYHDYVASRERLAEDLRMCPLGFLEYDVDKLINRMDVIRFNWVSFEELLGLPDLVDDHTLCNYRTWQEVLREMGREDFFTN